MRKIINGKAYDTDTATKLGTWENMDDGGNFSYVCETLYRKKTGEYFRYGYGGPMSRYAERRGYSTVVGGDVFEPLTLEEARAFAEKYLSAEKYEAEFGIVDE